MFPICEWFPGFNLTLKPAKDNDLAYFELAWEKRNEYFVTLTPGKDPIPWELKTMVTFYPIVEIASVITLILVTLKIRIHRKKFTPVSVALVTADVEKQNLAGH